MIQSNRERISHGLEAAAALHRFDEQLQETAHSDGRSVVAVVAVILGVGLLSNPLVADPSVPVSGGQVQSDIALSAGSRRGVRPRVWPPAGGEIGTHIVQPPSPPLSGVRDGS